MNTANRVPRWSSTSKKGGTSDAPEMFSRCSAMARWPELDTGRNSVTPWMTPRRTEENRVKGITLLTCGIFSRKTQYTTDGL